MSVQGQTTIYPTGSVASGSGEGAPAGAGAPNPPQTQLATESQVLDRNRSGKYSVLMSVCLSCRAVHPFSTHWDFCGQFLAPHAMSVCLYVFSLSVIFLSDSFVKYLLLY